MNRATEPARTVKSIITSFAGVVVLFVLLLSGVNIGVQAQSACAGTGHPELCHPPTTSSGGGGNSGGGNSGGGSSSGGNTGGSDNGQTRYERAAEHNRNGRIYQKRYEEAGQESDLKNAFAEFAEAWRIDEDGAVGIVELCNKIGNTQKSLEWAQAGLHTKYQDNGLVHAWLHYVISSDEHDLTQEQYNNQCTVHTSTPESGSTADVRANIMQSLKDCEKLQKKITSLQKKTEEDLAKYKKHQN